MNFKSLSVSVFLYIFIFGCGYSEKLKRGNEVVSKIEKFKSDNDKLPDSLGEIGIVETESGPIYYKKESDKRYIIWFGKDLGESVTYDSDTKQWE